MPDLHYEILYGCQTGKIICGIDEVGRGPLAGPVVTCAAILPSKGLPDAIAAKINDSKKLSEKQREALYEPLTTLCRYAIGDASVEEIDQINILNATMLAMQRAVEKLGTSLDRALIDGNRAPKLTYPTTPIVKGDSKSLSIATASIIAKVTRDRLMKTLARTYPAYGWDRNAGYGTATHMAALRTHGITPHHRLSFAPVAEAKIAFGS